MESIGVGKWPRAVEVGMMREPELTPRRGYRRVRRSKSGSGGRRGRTRRKAAGWDANAMMRAVEALSKLVTPQVLLPVQLKSEPEDLPEFALLRAVLLNAVVEYADSFKPSPTLEVAQRRREARKIAESWFAGDSGPHLNSTYAVRCLG